MQGRLFDSPADLEKYISKKQAISSIVKVARIYLNYCEKHELIPIGVINKYRKFLKTRRHQPDVYVPSTEEVLANFKKVRKHKALEIVYLVLMTSGIRYIECLNFLRDYDESKFQVHSNFVSYNVSKLRHTKNINTIYLPLFVYKKLRKVTNSYQALRMRLKEKGCTLSMKYLRKWNFNFLLYNNVPESVADFLQGRANKGIGATHYLAKAQQASYWYNKVTKKLEQLFQ